MNEQQWTTVDKHEWPEGEWTSEPDKVVWVDEASDLDCMIHRGPSGALCGYVGLPPGHPLHGKHYDDIDYEKVDPHGGLTFASACQAGDDPSTGICHVPADGRPEHVWWLGFDCAHAGDLCPAHLRFGPSFRDETYKNIAYVRTVVLSLAQQLASWDTP